MGGRDSFQKQLCHLWNKLSMGTRFTTMMVKYLQRQLGTDSVTNSVEDDVDSTRHDAAVPGHPLDCVRLASTGCSIGEEQLVLPLQEVPHHWSHHLPKHRGLATTWTENLGEGVPASAMIYLKGIFYSHPSPSSKFMSAWWHFGNLAKAMSIINSRLLACESSFQLRSWSS